MAEVAQSGQNIPATVPPTTFLAPTREGMQALRLANPKAYKPSTAMTFPGLRSRKDIDDVIGYITGLH